MPPYTTPYPKIWRYRDTFMGLVFIALVVAAVAVAAGFKKLNEDRNEEKGEAVTDREESSMECNQGKRGDDKE